MSPPQRVAALWTVPARLRLLPTGLRLGTAVAAYTTAHLAAPAVWASEPFTQIVMAITALACAGAPAGHAPLVTSLAAVGAWSAATAGYGEPVTVLRAAVLTALMYLLHQLATMAGAVPYDAVVAGDAVGRWLGRTLLVAVLSAAAAAAVLSLLPDTADAPGGYVVATATGLVAAIGVLLLLSQSRPRWPWRR